MAGRVDFFIADLLVVISVFLPVYTALFSASFCIFGSKGAISGVNCV